MNESRLGKIQSIRFGFGGRDDLMFGISFTLGGKGWGVGDFWGYWGSDIDPTASSGFKWNEADRNGQRLEILLKIEDLMRKAKVLDVTKLVGVPVEVEFDGTLLKSWRVLWEVL